MFLNKATSKLVRLGLFIKLRPAVPWVRALGAPTLQGSPKSGPTVWAPLPGTHPGFEPISGYESAPNPRARPALSSLPTPDVLAPLTTLNGVPVWKMVIPEIDQPPKRMRVSAAAPP